MSRQFTHFQMIEFNVNVESLLCKGFFFSKVNWDIKFIHCSSSSYQHLFVLCFFFYLVIADFHHWKWV
jgi:hypothetical protein